MERKIGDPGILRTFEAYAVQVQRLIDDYKSLDPEQRTFKPGQETWSIEQVFSHLIQVEHVCTEAILKRVAGGKYSKSRLIHSWRYIMLITSLRLPVKFKVPDAAPQIIPSKVISSDVISDWDTSLAKLQTLIAHFPSELSSYLLFKHPIAGPLNTKQAIGFLRSHLKHHLTQIQRIKQHPIFPGVRRAKKNNNR